METCSNYSETLLNQTPFLLKFPLYTQHGPNSTYWPGYR